MTHDTRTAGGIKAGELLPFGGGQEIRDRAAFGVALDAKQPDGGLIAIKDAAVGIHHEHAVLDDVEERFEKTAFAGEALDDRLQAFGIEPPEPAQDFI